jgi:hypothetical protein
VVLLQKGKFVSTLCDRMQGALNCVENWCREIGLSVNADKTTMVLFTNNRKVGGLYNDVFGNYCWYAFNTNVCFRGYVNVAILTFDHKTRGQKAANRLLGNGCSYVLNFGHSEVLIKMTDEMPLL